MNMPRQEGWPTPTSGGCTMSERTEIEALEIAGRVELLLSAVRFPTRPQIMAAVGFTRTIYPDARPYTPPSVIGRE